MPKVFACGGVSRCTAVCSSRWKFDDIPANNLTFSAVVSFESISSTSKSFIAPAREKKRNRDWKMRHRRADADVERDADQQADHVYLRGRVLSMHGRDCSEHTRLYGLRALSTPARAVRYEIILGYKLSATAIAKVSEV